MNYQQKLEYYASAKRITVEVIFQIENGNSIKYFCGKLRGKIVSTEKGFKFNTKEEAWQNAFNFRQSCLDEIKEQGHESTSN